MGKALYRTYRSKNLAEIVGQEHITTALNRALESGKLAHAYLFTGPKGVGKTSIARILAHEINQLPYNEESPHLDIIEIDAASNRRIDEIRDLRDKVHIAPTSAKYKVYIIDEVHMLTREAFNALLKTLEEPPAHVVFILATTEVHKLPETIISRTQRYTFKPVAKDKVVNHLQYIAKQEKIDIVADALGLIAEHGEGSFRDSISLLDQIRHSGAKITLEDVQNSLGIAPDTQIAKLVAAISNHETGDIIKILKSLREGGFEPAQVARQLGEALRSNLIENPSSAANDIELLRKLVEIPASFEPGTALEIALLDAALNGASKPSTKPKTSAQVVTPLADVQVEPHPSSFQKAHKDDIVPIQKTSEPQEIPVKPEEKTEPITPKPPKQASGDTLTIEDWQKTLQLIGKQYNTLHTLLKSAEARFEPGALHLTTDNVFYKKRIVEPKNKKIVTDAITEISGQKIQLICEKGEVKTSTTTVTPKMPPLPPADGEIVMSVQPAQPTSQEQKPPDNNQNPDAIKNINNIFGNAEVLES
jgi:DNA polymerase III subunit gamma/tau